jgi:hypothetical protein
MNNRAFFYAKNWSVENINIHYLTNRISLYQHQTKINNIEK